MGAELCARHILLGVVSQPQLFRDEGLRRFFQPRRAPKGINKIESDCPLIVNARNCGRPDIKTLLVKLKKRVLEVITRCGLTMIQKGESVWIWADRSRSLPGDLGD